MYSFSAKCKGTSSRIKMWTLTFLAFSLLARWIYLSGRSRLSFVSIGFSEFPKFSLSFVGQLTIQHNTGPNYTGRWGGAQDASFPARPPGSARGQSGPRSLANGRQNAAAFPSASMQLSLIPFGIGPASLIRARTMAKKPIERVVCLRGVWI